LRSTPTLQYSITPRADVESKMRTGVRVVLVPTGQQTVRTCPHFRFHIMPGFEDDDDEHENEDPSILSPNPPWC